MNGYRVARLLPCLLAQPTAFNDIVSQIKGAPLPLLEKAPPLIRPCSSLIMALCRCTTFPTLHPTRIMKWTYSVAVECASSRAEFVHLRILEQWVTGVW